MSQIRPASQARALFTIEAGAARSELLGYLVLLLPVVVILAICAALLGEGK